MVSIDRREDHDDNELTKQFMILQAFAVVLLVVRRLHEGGEKVGAVRSVRVHSARGDQLAHSKLLARISERRFEYGRCEVSRGEGRGKVSLGQATKLEGTLAHPDIAVGVIHASKVRGHSARELGYEDACDEVGSDDVNSLKNGHCVA